MDLRRPFESAIIDFPKMTLAPGHRLGPYEITSRLGAGGMGEVFRAIDTRLQRNVAIKVLAPEFAADPQRRARFEREARTISQLNHPHVCTLYDVGAEGTVSYLVMELIEGETLADRLSRGPMPLADVFRYGTQIADALDRAHRAGVVHRDLKPANVMITRLGAKLLDFGLARPSRSTVSEDAPTEQSPVTSEGVVVGTLPYMSPEQLQGMEADSRSDIFALGAVLYEMITGKRAFSASNSASLIASILQQQPVRPSELDAVLPSPLDHLVMTCLAKNPDDRFQCAADVAHQLRWIAGRSEDRPPATVAATPRSRRFPAAVAAALLLVAAVVAATSYWHRGHRTVGATARFSQLTFDSDEKREPAISPDGKLFAFVKNVSGHSDIFLQRIDGHSAINLTNEKLFDDSEPSFSPDGNLIAFRSERDGGGIFVMGATGESVRRIAERGHNPSWSPDGKQILFSEQKSEPLYVYGLRNLYVADLSTGASRVFYDGVDVQQPVWSPHGYRVAFWTAIAGTRDIQTIDRSGRASTVRPVTADPETDWNPVWSPDGRYLYFLSDRDGTTNLWRIAIDEASGQTHGQPEPLRLPSRATSSFSLAGDGRRFLYQSDTFYSELRRFEVDPSRRTLHGDPAPLLSGSLRARYFAQSPDGKWIALAAAAPQEDIYVMAADGTGIRQLTNDPARDRGVGWWPDSSRIVFYSNRSGHYDAWTIRPDGSGLTRLLAWPGGINFPVVSPDRRRLAFTSDAGTDGGIVDLAGGPSAQVERFPPLPQGRLQPKNWSPDGTMLVGTSYGGDGGAYVYSLGTKTVTALGTSARAASFIDSRRVLLVDYQDRIAIADVPSRQLQIVGSLSATASERAGTAGVVVNGGVVLVDRRQTRSEIWSMSLAEPTPAR